MATATSVTSDAQESGRVLLRSRLTPHRQTKPGSDTYPTEEQLIGLADLWVAHFRKRGLRNPDLKLEEFVDALQKNGLGSSYDGMRFMSVRMLNKSEAELCFTHTSRKSVCRIYTQATIPPMYCDS